MNAQNNTITLDVYSRDDAELLARALRDSVFEGLTVKQFHVDEAIDVLRMLHALMVNRMTDDELEVYSSRSTVMVRYTVVRLVLRNVFNDPDCCLDKGQKDNVFKLLRKHMQGAEYVD